jgi:hypothetical protein
MISHLGKGNIKKNHFCPVKNRRFFAMLLMTAIYNGLYIEGGWLAAKLPTSPLQKIKP